MTLNLWASSLASTAQGRLLTNAHRKTQNRLAQRTAAAMLQVWPLLDVGDIDGTVDRWLRAAVPLVEAQRAQSVATAANYYRFFRLVEGATGEFTPVVSAAQAIPREQIVTSLLVTGPHALKKNIGQGLTPSRALDVSDARAAGAAIRHVLNGGRDSLLESVEQDREAIGWARATSGSPCGFCAMLASRGPVYKSEKSGGFESHDSCGCTAEPLFDEYADWPDGAREFRKMWNEAVSADGDTTKVFRKMVTNPA